MPMPLSRSVRVPFVLSATIQIASSVSPAMSAGFDRDSKRSLSLASEAFEISSRRKISLWLYNEWIMSLSSSRTSAWKPKVSLAGESADWGVVMAPGRLRAPGPQFKPRSMIFGARGSAGADGRPDRHRGVLHVVAARADQVVQFIPEEEKTFHAMCPCSIDCASDRMNARHASLCQESHSIRGLVAPPDPHR